jgi:hypothetical protein
MLDRLQQGYRHRFRSLLARVRPRRLDFGVELLLARARERSARDGVPLPQALAELYEATRRRVDRRAALMAACAAGGAAAPGQAPPPSFVCDESLGGLARWLRAAGYQARWLTGARAEVLLAAAQDEGAVLLTSDSELAGRRVVRDGRVAALWVPTAMTRHEQMGLVLRDLGLELRVPRCMACGGTLAPVDKQEVWGRIPPRTARWKDDYYLCEGCGKLFWQGTHWERILARLAQAAPTT